MVRGMGHDQWQPIGVSKNLHDWEKLAFRHAPEVDSLAVEFTFCQWDRRLGADHRQFPYVTFS